MNFLKLIRFNNLIMLAIMQLVIRYGFLKQQDIGLALNHFQYILLVFATLFIASGGYVINDIFDQETDAINKPHKVIVGKFISEAKAYNIYVGLTIIGVGIGFYLSNIVNKPSFATLFILTAALLYFYATTLKQIPLVGNIVVASILAFSVIIIGFFDLFPNIYDQNQKAMQLYFSILIDYAKFAFVVNLAREIVKDSEDYKGDFQEGISTLPVAIGIKKTNIITCIILLLSASYLSYYSYIFLMQNNLYLATLYMIVFIIAPLIFCFIKLLTAQEKQHFSLISMILKWIIFFGILSIVVITYNKLHYA